MAPTRELSVETMERIIKTTPSVEKKYAGQLCLKFGKKRKEMQPIIDQYFV